MVGLVEQAHGTGSWNELAHGTGSWNGLIERYRVRVHVRAHVWVHGMGSFKAIHGFLAALTRGDKEETSTLKYRPRALHFVIQYATCTLAKLKIKLVDPLFQEMSVTPLGPSLGNATTLTIPKTLFLGF
ncbi:hypothetical protein V1478_008679 [Vespula squamosa]|uniref:Uncharacterized protein n=1 Tax=Vespula squamosa TaxID=30214 RepID=A0ABD2AU99_VESSQ